MYTVTSRIRDVKQPWGGFLRPSSMQQQIFSDNLCLQEGENIHPSIIGLVVDYITRYMITGSGEKAFQISLKGAGIAALCYGDDRVVEIAYEVLSHIKSLDNKSIYYASKMVSFDIWYRNPSEALKTFDPGNINPSESTIENIRIMIKRSLDFWNKYGPVVVDGFTFEPSGYSTIVSNGEGDYLTSDTIWDFKVLKSKPTSKHTLQILMYWIMGQHSGNSIFNSITKIGMFNPRLNIAYFIPISEISKDTIKQIESEVICY